VRGGAPPGYDAGPPRRPVNIPSSAPSSAPTPLSNPTPLPLVDLRRLHEPLAAELGAAFARVLASGVYHLGPETRAFESELAAHEGAAHAVCCGSGSDAIFLALRALGIGPGHAVVTLSNSFVATAESVVRTGAQVFFAEPEPESRNLDPEDLRDLLRAPFGDRIRAVVPVHLYGRPADTVRIREVLHDAGRDDVVVIGDAAQAHGSPGIGAATPIACYSFYPAKNLGALGDGGAVLTQDAALAERVRRLRNHGRAGKHHCDAVGLNSRFDEIQAAALRIKLRHLRAWNEDRRRVAALYGAALARAPGLVLPLDGEGHVWHLYVVEVLAGPAARDAIALEMRAQGVECGLHYPVPVHEMPPYPANRPLPVTVALCARVLSLPMFPGMRQDEVARVATALRAALARHGVPPGGGPPR
jgi:dTDP-3-amino-3,4,6-trideoxy-alpha-D-glucose transaminase